MDYVSLIKVADEYAAKKHEGQKDESGVAYIEHPRNVAAQLTDPFEVIIGLLHDTIEDTTATYEEIKKIFGKDVADGVLILTKRPGEKYMDFIKRCSSNPATRHVKMADIRHNLDPTRLENPTQYQIRRRKKYQKAYSFLERKDRV